MAKILVVGAGFAGHFAAMTLSDQLKKKGLTGSNEITVISRQPKFTYIPSLIWVGIGKMQAETTQFELDKVYKKLNIGFIVGRVFEVHPDDRYVVAETQENSTLRVSYDYLIMATGPFLNFAATPGLGPDHGHTYSVCTPDHAAHTSRRYLQLVSELEKGRKADVVIGTGHGTCTCQGAAIEFLFNVHFDLEARGLRHLVNLTWLSNEPRLGDLGIDGVEAKNGEDLVTSEEIVTELFKEYQIQWEVKSHVYNITENRIEYETLEGEKKEKPFDFAMLLPPFKGQPIQYFAADGSDITEKMCNPAGFVKVDAVYGNAYPELDGPDWPKTYQSPVYENIYAAGIAFAPPGPLSLPQKSPNGTMIAPSPPRTGFTSELCGHAAALNIIDMLEGKKPAHSSSMAESAGVCVASMHNRMFGGNAMIIGVYPVARNRKNYPATSGRDLSLNAVDIGQSGAWFKKMLHHMFLYKLQGRAFWSKLP